MTTEQQTGFTPGPMKVEQLRDDCWVIRDVTNDTYALDAAYGGEDKDGKANANLWAAAPELFEQLLAVYDYYHLSLTPAAFARRCTELMDDIKAALAKARGES